MSLTIITGPAQAGKTQTCIEALARSKPAEIILVCATSYLADSLGRRLTLRHQQQLELPSQTAEALPQITTTTFLRMIDKLWGLQGDERAFVGPAQREALVDELLADLAPAAHTTSLLTTGGCRFLAEVLRACTTLSAPSARDSFVAMLQQLIERYQISLRKRSLIEPDAALSDLARRRCATEAAYGFLGFTDFPPAQQAYVDMLSASREVAVAITCAPTGEATEEGRRFATSLAQHYQDQAGREALWAEAPLGSGGNSSAALAQLRANFLRSEDNGRQDPASESEPRSAREKKTRLLPAKEPRPASGEETTCVEFIAAQGEDEEILQAVQAAVSVIDDVALQCKIVADHTQPVTDDAPVALIFRRLGARATALARALDACHVVADFDLTISFQQTGLGAALCALLRLPFAADDLAVLAGGYLLSAYSGASQAQAAIIERKLREGRMNYLGFCCALGLPDVRQLSAEDWAQLATTLLFRGAAVVRGEYQNQLDFAAHKVFCVLLDEMRGLGTARRESGADECSSPPDSNAADAAGAGEYRTPLQARQLLASLEQAQVNLTPPPGSTRLLVSEASRVRGRQFHTVILAGLAQRDFESAAEPSIAERTIAQVTGHAEPDKLAGEHQLWYDLLGCARASLVLVAQNQDLSGQTLPPSAFLEELLWLCGKKEWWEEGESAAAGAGEHASPQRAADPAQGALIGDTSLSVPQLPKRGQLRGLDFSLHAAAPYAVTTLERYARCPYAWFLGRFVARKGIIEDAGPLNEGIILHRALRRFYELAPAELGEAHVRVATLAPAQQLLDQCFEAACQETLQIKALAELPAVTRVSLAALRESLQNFLASEVDWLPGFTPRYFELKFGEPDEASSSTSASGPGAVLSASSAPLVAGVPVCGAIDRIDVYEPPRAAGDASARGNNEVGGGDEERGAAGDIDAAGDVSPADGNNDAGAAGALFIIDYKRNGAAHGGLLQARANNKEIQATVYGLVAEQLFPGLRYVGSSYRNISNPANRRIEHRKSARLRYWEEMGFPQKTTATPAATSDDAKKGAPSTYEKGIEAIKAIVSDAAAGLNRGDAPIAAPLNAQGEPKRECPFTRDCLHQACPYYRQGAQS